jgi:hypothetical protein
MMRVLRIIVLGASVLVLSHAALAQTVAPASSSDGDWRVTVYPILAWVPLDIGIKVNVPPIDTDGGGSTEILDSQFDGAFFGGVAASNGPWRIDGYGLWASLGGNRTERPSLTVDLDLIYGSARLGRRVAPDLYVTGGVRRLALDYDITLGDLPHFARKPGVWDPIVGSVGIASARRWNGTPRLMVVVSESARMLISALQSAWTGSRSRISVSRGATTSCT